MVLLYAQIERLNIRRMRNFWTCHRKLAGKYSFASQLVTNLSVIPESVDSHFYVQQEQDLFKNGKLLVTVYLNWLEFLLVSYNCKMHLKGLFI